MEHISLINEFATDTIEGLSSNNKFLSSKYFYDDKGSRIFQDIMRMPEYYLTDCELEIFETQKQHILDELNTNHGGFQLIELGAGDGLKTKILLKHFLEKEVNFKYSPIDISKDAVVQLVDGIRKEYPQLKVKGLIGDYFNLISQIQPNGYSKKIVLFLGSNIGNFDRQTSLEFLTHLKEVLNPQDQLLIGFDMKKDPEVILKAYNDPHGYTASFNLNLLRRINRELDADFNIENFKHEEIYNPDSGEAKSYLISLTDQSVYIAEIDKTIDFVAGEKIYMEMSQKYDKEMINNLAEDCGFEIVRNFTDKRQFFMNSLWKLK